MQRFQQSIVVEVPDEPSCLEYPVLAGLLDEPVLLSTLARDGQRGARVCASDPRQGSDEIVHTLLVFEPPDVEQLGRPGARAPFRERPTRRVDSVADHVGLGQAGAEELGDLLAHRRRTGDKRIGFTHQPRLHRVHLAADRTGNPAGMPPGLRRVNGRNHWYVVELGQRHSRVSHQPVVRVYHVGTPGAVGAVFLEGQPGADHRVTHRQGPGHHVRAEGELVRILRGGDHPDTPTDLVRGRMRAGIRARRAARQHHDVVTGRGQRRRQVMHVPAEAADYHRRVLPRQHQDLHGRPRPTISSVHKMPFVAACRRADMHARVGRAEFTGAAAAHPERRTARRRGSSRRPAAARCPAGPTPAPQRSRGWRGHVGARGNGRSRRPNPCSP